MGNSYQKDQKVDIYMDIDRPYYVAGQQVHGCAYLDIKEQRAYETFQIVISGHEHIQWVENHGQNYTRVFSNDFDSYQSAFNLHNFKGNVPTGQYSFPFSFKLPSMMSGSFTYSKDCYIQYTCIATLTHLQKKKSQVCILYLNILEPPRSLLGPIQTTNHTHSQCCRCCFDYGQTTVIMNCNKNFVTTGDQFSVKGLIDHSRGKIKIKSGRIVLEQRTIMISSERETEKDVIKSYPLYEITKAISSGQKYKFNFQSRIPNQIGSYTAIGSVAARYFIIRLYTEYGCCAQTAKASLHLVVHSRKPQLMVNKEQKKPANWYPKEFPLVACKEMKPFVYNPLPQMPYDNMPNLSQSVYVTEPQSYTTYEANFTDYQEPQFAYLLKEEDVKNSSNFEIY